MLYKPFGLNYKPDPAQRQLNSCNEPFVSLGVYESVALMNRRTSPPVLLA